MCTIEQRRGARQLHFRRVGGILGHLNSGALLLLVVLLFPLAILLIGTPVALFARLLVEIARRL